MTHDKMFKEMLDTLTARRQVDEAIYVDCANDCCEEVIEQEDALKCEECKAPLCLRCSRQFDLRVCEECYRGIEEQIEYYNDLESWHRATR